MNIRLLEDNDQGYVEAIMASHSLQFPSFIIEKYPPRWSEFLELQNPIICGYYVAYTDVILGHAGYILDPETGIYEIVGVVIHKQSQRMGIGKLLLEAICKQVDIHGGKQVILTTLGHVENESTLAFYRNMGYEQVNYEQDFFQTDYHRVTFLKKWA